MNVSVIHCSSKIVFLILNCLTFYLHACHVSENTVYIFRSNDSFLGDSEEGFFICTLLYRIRIKINIMKVNYWLKVYFRF
ncbi:hypothetical protein BW900_08240 [Bacillus mycoides]|uniref:Uncharacterized protein n=1 Tax=Bacillus mycoides TaxID=1405 RepID=A0A1S9TC81_BACMY|nr:hypothetical protein BW900_08240 [Bacillus mycoides]